ncbi:Alpha-amylase [Schizosaccharomyces pombe]
MSLDKQIPIIYDFGENYEKNKDIWRRQCIYQILTDRFALDDHCTTAPSTGRMYLGGTWRGIIQKLDYIQSLGCTAVWISPIVKNIEGVTGYGEAYHGYWAEDLTQLNPHFGTKQDLTELVDQLHKRNMLCMIDIVVNHMAHAGDSPIDYSKYAPFNSPSHYHPKRFLHNYDDTWDCEIAWLGDEVVSLMDIRTEDQEVHNFFQNWIRDLIQTYHFDGLRIDTAKHVQKEFYPPFIAAANVFAFGEVYHGDPKFIAKYLEYIPSAANYPLYYQIENTFFPPKQSMNIFYQKAILEARATSMDTTILGNFTENHDVPRFLNRSTDYSLLCNTLTLLLFTDGIPIIFQGQEQMYAGGHDPENRDALWTSNYNQQNPIFQFLKKLIKLRQFLVDNVSGFTTELSNMLFVNEHVYVFRRPGVIIVVSNAGSNSDVDTSAEFSITERESLEFIDVLSGSRFSSLPTEDSSTISMNLEFSFPRVLVHRGLFHSMNELA